MYGYGRAEAQLWLKKLLQNISENYYLLLNIFCIICSRSKLDQRINQQSCIFKSCALAPPASAQLPKNVFNVET